MSAGQEGHRETRLGGLRVFLATAGFHTPQLHVALFPWLNLGAGKIPALGAPTGWETFDKSLCLSGPPSLHL